MSSEAYNAQTAYHYEAYRPPLHSLILKKSLLKKEFENGLDIGCGTGKSTIALKQFCKKTVGMDPSTAMLEKTAPQEGISYEYFDGLSLNKRKNSFDIITLAGSWWYGKSQQLLQEIFNVGTSDAFVLLYDFEILFNSIYHKLRLEQPAQINDYDHFVDFTGLNTEGFRLVSKVSDKIRLNVTAEELAHLICSENGIFRELQQKYGTSRPFKKLVHELQENASENGIRLLVNTFSTSYKIIK